MDASSESAKRYTKKSASLGIPASSRESGGRVTRWRGEMGPLSSVMSLSRRDCKRLSCSRTVGGPTTQHSPRRLRGPLCGVPRRLGSGQEHLSSSSTRTTLIATLSSTIVSSTPVITADGVTSDPMVDAMASPAAAICCCNRAAGCCCGGCSLLCSVVIGAAASSRGDSSTPPSPPRRSLRPEETRSMRLGAFGTSGGITSSLPPCVALFCAKSMKAARRGALRLYGVSN